MARSNVTAQFVFYFQSCASACHCHFSLKRWVVCVASLQHCCHPQTRSHPTMVAWVLSQVRSHVICDGQSGIVEGFLQVLLYSFANSYSTNCSSVICSHVLIMSLISSNKKIITLECNHCQNLNSSIIQFCYQAQCIERILPVILRCRNQTNFILMNYRNPIKFWLPWPFSVMINASRYGIYE